MDIGIISTVVSGLSASAFAFNFVKEGEIGCITTFGKAHRNSKGDLKLIKSGFKIIVPFVQKIHKVHIKKNTSSYKDLKITLKNGLSYNFDAYIVYHTILNSKSVENIIFGLENYQEYVSLIFERVIQDVLQNVEEVEFEKINKKMMDKVKPLLQKEGFQVDECGLLSFSATENSQSLLGINYKLKIAGNSKIDKGIIATAIGATPTVDVNKNYNKNVIKKVDDDDDED